MMAVSLTEEQRAVIGDHGGELLVSAAAGSGKTFVLVERLLNRVTTEGIDLDRFLIITYTKAAAAELRGKIIDALNRRLAEEPDNRILQRQSSLVYHTQISTIHAFCQMILREEGHCIDMDPDFRVADENAGKLLKRRVLDRVLERHYKTVEAGDGFSHLLDTMSAGRDDSRLINMVLQIHEKVQSYPDPHAWLEGQCSAFSLDGITDAGQTVWGQVLIEDSLAQTEYWHSRMGDLLRELNGEGALEDRYAPVLEDLMDDLDSFADALRSGVWDRICVRNSLRYGILHPPIGKPYDKELAGRVRDTKSACKEKMDRVTARFDQKSEVLLADIRTTAPAVISLMHLVEELDDAFAAEKRRQKLADFSDLEHLALRILTDSEGRPTAAAGRYQHRYLEVMVDEYQDTNRVQNAIFSAVSQCGKDQYRLVQVGDVKQSIYRFRLADPTIFLGKLEAFPPRSEAEEGGPRKIILGKNFRSRKSVLDAANFVFRSIMQKEFAELDYTNEHWLYPGAAYPPYDGDRTELHVIDLKALEDLPLPDGEKKPGKTEVEADYAARHIRALMDGGYQVTDGDAMRPVRWSDIAILQRSPSSSLRELTDALDRHRIPWQLESDRNIFDTPEIQTALSCLQIIDNPHQDIPLIAVLRSPLFGFSPDQLAAIRAARRDGNFYTALCQRAEDGDAACIDFLTTLEDLRFRAADRPASGVLWEMYEQTGMLPIFGSMEGGETRRGNLILLYEYARRFERESFRSLFDFVSQLHRMEAAGQEIKISGTQGTGVRIMSIHKSKGLEFPVVVLSGLSHQFNTEDEKSPMLFHDQLGVGPKGLDAERGVEYTTLPRTAVALKLHRQLCAEEVRLLYVAMTRAREKLIMTCTVKDASKELPKLCMNAAWPMQPQVLMGMNSMKDWVLSAAMTRREASALHEAAGQPDSLYPGSDTPWEIVLRSAEVPGRTVRTRTAGERRTVTDIPMDALKWTYPHASAPMIPSKLTATQVKGRYRDEEAAEDAAVPGDADRPAPRPVTFREPAFLQEPGKLSPTQRGTAQHLFVQLCDPERAATVSGAKAELKRLTERGCLTEAQAKACSPAKIAAFFRSDLGRTARACGMNREFKFSMFSDAGRYYGPDAAGEQILLQGVVDLWFQTIEGIAILDFKTDFVTPGGEARYAERYRGQMNVYASALAEITGRPVVHRYLWFFCTDCAVEL